MARLLKVSGRAGRWTPLGKGWSSVSASIVAAWVIMVLSAFQVVQAAAPVVESSSSKSNINTSSVTRLDVSIDRPADTQVGDLLVASVRVTRDGSVTNGVSIDAPDGWTEIRTDQLDNRTRVTTYWRVSGAGDLATWTWTGRNTSSSSTAAFSVIGGILRISGADTAAPIDVHGGTANDVNTSANVPAGAVTTTVADTLLIYSGSLKRGAGTFTPPLISGSTRMTEVVDINTVGSGDARTTFTLATEERPTAGPTGTRTGVASFNGRRQIGHLIAIKPQTKQDQTITFGADPGPKTFGDDPFEVSATADSGLDVTFTSQTPGVCTNVGNTVTIVSAGTCTIAANQAGNDDYNPADEVTQGITIDKATPTVTLAVNNSPVTYDGTAQSATVGITESSVPGIVSNILADGATTQTNAGTYPVTATFTPNDTTNYNTLTNVSAGNFVIDKADQTITFGVNPGPKTFGDAPFGVSATADSGLDVTFTSQTLGVCTNVGNTVTIVSAGTCTIAANQAGNDNYNAATEVTQDITIEKAAQAALDVMVDGSKDPAQIAVGGTATLSSTGGTGDGVVSYQTTGPCTVNDTTLTGNGVGTCQVTATKAADDNYQQQTSSNTVTVDVLATEAAGTEFDAEMAPGSTCVGFETAQFLGSPANPVTTDPMTQMFNFRAVGCGETGGSVTINLIFDNALPPETQVWKWNGNEWITLTDLGVDFVINGNIVSYTITDGGPGDLDGEANGEIVDPVAVSMAMSRSIPTLGLLGLLALGGLMALSGMLGQRQRHRI